jgi:hypothetical protein
MRQLKAAVSHRVRLIEELRADLKLAREYLAAALEKKTGVREQFFLILAKTVL